MQLPIDVAVLPDGLGLSFRGRDETHTSVALKHLASPRHLLSHPGARIETARVEGTQLSVTLDDGSTHRTAVDRVDHLVARAKGNAPTASDLSPVDASPVDLLITGIGELLTANPEPNHEDPLGLVQGAALATRGGRVVAVGPEAAVREQVQVADDALVLEAGGRFVSPGLVDPHTHPVFGGDRSGEFALRARGATYQEIAAAGGGIRSTVQATRAASEAELVRSAAGRLAQLMRHGVTTAEAKSGYALETDGELKMLRVIRHLDRGLPMNLSPTLLGAHIVPPEHAEDRGGYVDRVCEEMIPAAARESLAESVDVFCDAGAFTREESERVLHAARDHGLARRIHAEQFVDLGSAGMAAELGAVSADHLEAVSEADMAQMAEAGTVAVLLPGAALTLRCPWPPAAALREAGVPLALGTDLNPGTSTTTHLPLMMSLGCMQMGMTVPEVWLGVTTVAARAALRPEAGRLAVGGPADLVIWECAHHGAVPYHLGANLVRTVIKAGRVAVDRAFA